MALTRVSLPDQAEKAAVVEAMFDRIAPRYDLMNRLMTLRLDQRWRRLTIRLLRIGRGDTVVDLGCGTGDMCELAAATGARVIGIDFAAQMLTHARARRVPAQLVRADAAELPLPSASATAVTSAFALRNFVSISAVVQEAARILRPGGRLGLLEVDAPCGRLMRWGHTVYFRHVVPVLGALLSDRSAYTYLPQSTAYLPTEPQLLDCVKAAGLHDVVKHRLSGGIAQLILAQR